MPTGEDFDSFLESLNIESLMPSLSILNTCIQFGHLSKVMIECQLDDLIRSNQNDKELDDTLSEFLLFNELIIMSEMMVNLVGFEDAKKNG